MTVHGKDRFIFPVFLFQNVIISALCVLSKRKKTLRCRDLEGEKMNFIFAVLMSVSMMFPVNTTETTDYNSCKEIVTAIIKGTESIKSALASKTNKKEFFLKDTEASVKKEKNAYTVTDEELEILYRIVEAETDGTLEQKINVCSCIFSRIESTEFPDTVKKVVFQKSQFSPISDGRYYTVKVSDRTKEAVEYVLKNGITFFDKDGNADIKTRYLFFCSYGCKSSYFAKKDTKLANKGKECMRDGTHRYYVD